MGDPTERPAQEGVGGDPGPDDAASTPAAEPAPTDLGRRRFFRQLTSDMIQTAATVVGAANAIQRTTTEAASAILDPAGAAGRLGGPLGGGVTPIPGGAATPGRDAAGGAPGVAPVFRSAFREEEGAIVLVDGRRLPEALVEYRCESAAEVAHAIREGVVRGPGAVAQVAALALALSARRNVETAVYGRRAVLRGSANALRNGDPGSFLLRRTVARMLERFATVGELEEDGAVVAAAFTEEAYAIVAELLDAQGRIADAALAALPSTVDAPLHVLTLGSTGVLAGGQFGTALGVVSAAVAEGRDLRVTVAETRPFFDGARLAAWELAQRGIPTTVVTDAAAPGRIAAGAVDLVLVDAERIAANGDAIAAAGTYPLAVVAARHGVPLLICAPLALVDLEHPDGSTIALHERAGSGLAWEGGRRIVPEGVHAVDPAEDRVPAELIGGIVTEAGILRAPYGPAIAGAVGTHLPAGWGVPGPASAGAADAGTAASAPGAPG